jgi:alpha-1,3-rhamnosyltransferase
MIATELQEETGQTLERKPAGVSVVVPSHNHAQFVEATLRSIMKQTLPPAELIVIDDGSSDESAHVIECVLSDCSFPCELIARENRGLCATLNEGFERSRGAYFAYLGSDDLWLPEFLQARVRLLEARPRAVIGYGHAFFVDEQNRVVDSTADWAHYADGDVREMLLQTTAPMSPTVVYRRAALAALTATDGRRWNEAAKLEDYDLYLRLSAAGDFAFDARVLSAWRRHGSNVSWDQTLMLEEQLRAQREAAVSFGFSDERIAKLQRTTRFNRAEDFLRVGQKSQALSLLMNNWRGADSSVATARMLLRLLLPNSIMRRRARLRQRRATARYGTIDVQN